MSDKCFYCFIVHQSPVQLSFCLKFDRAMLVSEPDSHWRTGLARGWCDSARAATVYRPDVHGVSNEVRRVDCV